MTSEEQTKEVKENETKKNQVTNKKVGKPKTTTANVVEEPKPKDIGSSKNQVKDFKVNDQPKKVQVAKVKQMKEVVVSQFDQNQSLKKSNKPQKRNKITKENAEIRI